MSVNVLGNGWDRDKLFPIVAVALVVVLIVGMLGIGAYVLFDQSGSGTPEVQAKAPAVQASTTPLVVVVAPTTESRSTAPPTNTPVAVATSTLTPIGSEQVLALTPLPTPVMFAAVTPVEAGPEPAPAPREMPETGFGVVGSLGAGMGLIGLMWAGRKLRCRRPQA